MKHFNFIVFGMAAASFTSCVANSATTRTDLSTIGEKTQYLETGRADETERLCLAFQKSYPTRVRCVTYGVTPQGRNLKALIITDSKSKAALKNPSIWIQAGIHSGEIDGKDAGFKLIRDALEQKITPDPFKGLKTVFVPIVNLDGHERFGPWNRPNQIGPKEMGWRTTAQNFNMNRDFAKAETPEMQAMLKLWDQYDPILSADLHVTDGANFQPEVGIVIEPAETGTSDLRKVSKKLEEDLMQDLLAQKHLALPYYPELEEDGDPASGFSKSQSTARFSDGYWSSRNRIGILVETHSWKTNANRVKSQYDVVWSLFRHAQIDGKNWVKAAHALDATNLADQNVDLEFKHSPKKEMIDFPGYHYEKDSHSKVSGGTAVKYYDQKPEIWKVPFYPELLPSLSVHAPKLGYFIPPEVAIWMKAKLDLHQIHYEQNPKLDQPDLETFRATSTEFAKAPYEGRQTVKLSGAWIKEKQALAKGTIFVPIHQANARLAMTLLEPLSVDSFVAWGFLNSAFEQKEYMEEYVAEAYGEKLLKDDPKVREAFEARLKSDKEFEKSPKQRLEFFYKLSPSYDQKLNLYPVSRV